MLSRHPASKILEEVISQYYSKDIQFSVSKAVP